MSYALQTVANGSTTTDALVSAGCFPNEQVGWRADLLSLSCREVR